MAGRGFGKTRTGGETVQMEVMAGKAKRIALIGPTAADTRDVMVEGESGLLAVAPPWFRPIYEPTKRRLTWPNGAIATLYSADKPERLRGPQHDLGWCDELASWRYPEAWDMFQLGLRLGDNPRVIVTTTPKPRAFLIQLKKDPNTVLSTGSTYENKANLADAFIDVIIAKYEGSTLGRQELYAELLEEAPGALWKRKDIDNNRWDPSQPLPKLTQIAIGVDPAVTNFESSDATGIIVAGRFRHPDGTFHAMVLNDQSMRGSPDMWATKVNALYEQYEADRVIGESNNGGDMVEHTIKSKNGSIPVTLVRASRGKIVRAEPIAALYEQGRVHHTQVFRDLEDQMCSYCGEDSRENSPDNMDAAVWVLSHLMLGKHRAGTWGS